MPALTWMNPMPSPAARSHDRCHSRPLAWHRISHAVMLLALLLTPAAAAVQDLYPSALLTTAGYCPWSNRDHLQSVINAYGATGVLLDPSVDYSKDTHGIVQTFVIGSNTQIYGVNTLIGSFTIAAGAHDVYLSGLNAGTVTMQAGAQISRVIFNRMGYIILVGQGCRIDELTWFDAYNCDIALDCSLAGYVRNFRVIRDANQDNTEPFSLKGNSAEPSYGNNIVSGNYLNGGSPQGPRVSMNNVGDWLTIQIGAESYNGPQNPWFSPMNVPNVRCIGTGGLVDSDNVWKTNSPNVLLVGDQMQTFNRGTTTTTATDHVYLPGVLSKVSVNIPYPPQQWSSTFTYNQYNQVYYGANGRYSSTVANNLNNPPSPTSPFWSVQQYIGYDDEDDNNLSQVTRSNLFDNNVLIAKTITINGVSTPTSPSPATIQTIRATAAAPNSGLLPWNPPTYATPTTTFTVLPVSTTAAQIQAQLDDLTQSGAVRLPAGIYTLSQPLLLGLRADGKRRILIGAGKSQTVLQAASSTMDLIQDHHDANGLSSIDIVDLTLTGGSWGINLFSVMSGGDWVQLQYTDSLMSSVCICNMSSGGVQIQNIFGMDNNAFQDVDFVNCPVGWQQMGGSNDASGNNWAYMDKNMWLGCQFINCPTAVNLVEGGRAGGANVFMETLFTGCTTGIVTNGAQDPLYWINCDLVNNGGNPMIYDYGECYFISTRISANPAAGVTQSVYDGVSGSFEGCLFTQTGAGSCTVIRLVDPTIHTAQNQIQADYDGRCTHYLNCYSTMSIGQWYNGTSINCNFSNPTDLGLHLNGALVYAYSDTSAAVGMAAPLPGSALSYTVLDPSVPSPQPAVLLCAHQYANPLVPVPAGIPSITSATTVAMAYNSAASFQVTASNSPTSFTAQGLPPGLSIDPAAGLISGTPSASGSWLVPLFAGNAAGSSGALLTITVVGQGAGAPVFAAVPNPITGTTNVALSQSLAASTAISYSAQGLPAGLSIDPVAGLISGTPTYAGTSSCLILASNASGTSIQQVNFSIAGGTPAFSPGLNLSTVTGYVGAPLSIKAGASGATSYGASGLPSGMIISATTGLISGTPTAAGSTPVSITATGTGGTSTANVTIAVIALTAPQFAAFPNPIPAVVGTPFSINLAATDDTLDGGLSTIWYRIYGNLPAGLVLQVNGSITGTPTAAGTSSSTLIATGLGGATSATLNWSITNPIGGGSANSPSGGGGSSGGCGLGVGAALLTLFSLLGLQRRRIGPRPG